MIACNRGTVAINGEQFELWSELATLMRVFIEEGIADIDELHSIVDTSSLTDKELHEEVDKVMSDIINTLLKNKTHDSSTEFEEKSPEKEKQTRDVINLIKEVQRRKK